MVSETEHPNGLDFKFQQIQKTTHRWSPNFHSTQHHLHRESKPLFKRERKGLLFCLPTTPSHRELIFQDYKTYSLSRTVSRQERGARLWHSLKGFCSFKAYLKTRSPKPSCRSRQSLSSCSHQSQRISWLFPKSLKPPLLKTKSHKSLVFYIKSFFKWKN